MSLVSSLTPQQERVLDLMASGSKILAAATTVGVHRNTVINWMRDETFRNALADMKTERESYFLEKAKALAADALAVLSEIAHDLEAPKPTRYRAAQSILQYATRFLPTDDPGNIALPAGQEKSEKVHKNAQPALAELPEEVEKSEILHKSAQPGVPVRSSKIGRNQPCPCGSGKKYKHCCLNAAAPTPDGAPPLAPVPDAAGRPPSLA